MPSQHWRVNALVLVDPTAAPPPAAVLEVEPSSLLMLPGRATPVRAWLANPGSDDVTVTPTVAATDGYEVAGDVPALRVPAEGVARSTSASPAAASTPAR